MSNTKRVLFPYAIFDATSLAADATSEETSVAFIDYGVIDISWTGSSPVGNINLEFLKIAYDRNSQNVDEWQTINFTGAPTGENIPISGASGEHQIQLNKMPSTRLRLKYVRTSGTGSLTAIISGKEA